MGTNCKASFFSQTFTINQITQKDDTQTLDQLECHLIVAK